MNEDTELGFGAGAGFEMGVGGGLDSNSINPQKMGFGEAMNVAQPYIQGGMALYSMGNDIGKLANANANVQQGSYSLDEMPTYQEQENPFKKGVGGTNALKWGSTGAGIGTSIMPGVGTAIGAGVGVVAGGISGAINQKKRNDFNESQANEFQSYNKARGNYFLNQAQRRQRMARIGLINRDNQF